MAYHMPPSASPLNDRRKCDAVLCMILFCPCTGALGMFTAVYGMLT
jgi:hypothetical protein